MNRKHRGLGARSLVAVSAVAAFSLLGAATASAAPPPTTASIVDPSTNKPLNSGDANTTWTIVLPPQASCSGDTATNGYHVYSYIVMDSAIGSDPSTLTFNASSGPNTGLPLFDTSGGQYVSKNTAPQTGQVIQIPNFNYAVYGPTDLPTGLYDVGIACTKPTTGSGALTVDKFWNVQENIVSDPNGSTITSWTVVVVTTTPESALAIALPVTAVAVMGLGAFYIVRRRRDGSVAAV